MDSPLQLVKLATFAADCRSCSWCRRVAAVSLQFKIEMLFYIMVFDAPVEKRGGAWMDEVVGRSKLMALPGQDIRLPVAHMVSGHWCSIPCSPISSFTCGLSIETTVCQCV